MDGETGMNRTMRGARLHAIGDLRVEDLPMPSPGPGEVLLQVASVGVCGSDVHYFKEGRIGEQVVREPLVLGHEFSAWVAGLGAGVTSLEVGQLVAPDPAVPCHHCECCEEGNPNLCPDVLFCGTPPVRGVFSEYVAMPAENCFRLPKAFTPAEGALLEPFGIGLYTVDLAALQAGMTVAVLGAGPIGLLTAAAARAAGAAKVYMTEPLAYRRQFAREYVADEVFDPYGTNVVDEVLHLTDGRGVDVAFDAAGAPETPNEAAGMARRGGQMVIVGIPSDDMMAMRTFTPRLKGLTIKLVRRMKLTYPRAIRLVETGMVAVEPLATHTFPLERITEAFQLVGAYADGVVKAIVEVSHSPRRAS
jgi:L-iditol 2-dehydrogenase